MDKARYLYKLRFNILIHQAIAKLRAQGRRVVLVGDLNISLNRIDTSDPDMSDDFHISPSRAWLRTLLQDQALEDVFRIYHPHKRLYTCWNQQTGARLTNYGTRIDYVLADSELLRQRNDIAFSGCEIQGHEGHHARGSDHCPVLAWLTLSGACCLPTDSWWASAADRGHASNAQPSRRDRQPPALCATFLPEVRKSGGADQDRP